MRLALVLIFVVSTLLCGLSTDGKIKHSMRDLSLTLSKKKAANRQLEKIAADIKKTEDEIVSIEKKMVLLEGNRKKNELRLASLKKELQHHRHNYEVISRELTAKERRFLSLLSKQFSIVYALQQFKTPTKESILYYEAYEVYKKYNNQQLVNLKKEIERLKREQAVKRQMRQRIEKEIDKIVSAQKEYEKRRAAKKRLLAKLEEDEEHYSARLKKLEDRQNSLRATLAKLNILHAQEVEEQKRRARARQEAIETEKIRNRKMRSVKAQAKVSIRRAKETLRRAKNEAERIKARMALKRAQSTLKELSQVGTKVRQVNSSYKKPRIALYKGQKTIPPIAGAKVIKRFGTYIDPIYKIKIFNDSVTLLAPYANAKVKSVLSGKVVFAGETSMLGKVVVIAHAHKLHTVYAGLSKIAPTLKVGKSVRKGYVIGRVVRKLLFQATKNSQHIDPLQLIRL